MITHLHIKNFKSHSDTALPLSNLNIFAGQNGAGKSSIFQSLLLLRQSHLKNRLHEGIDLNKPLCDIGRTEDALYQYAKDEIIEFGLTTTLYPEPLIWKFDAQNPKANFLDAVQSVELPLNGFSLFNSNFQYLSAARLGPKESYDQDDYAVARQRQISLEKGQGELTAHFLNFYGKKEKINFQNLIHPANADDAYLLAQTTAWEREISQNVNVVVNELPTGKLEIRYTFDVPGVGPTKEFRAENVGFGVSYSLPIIVAVLSAKKDAILLIENPEAHLAPHAQSKLAGLIALAAQSGVQVFVETHSDHIINGTLVAMRQHLSGGNGIAPENVQIFYFDRDEHTHSTRCTNIPITESGRIRDVPKGFFDQYRNDIKALV
ncbi:MAG: AAA family ATPase [Saprospiraceae bacterium]